MGISILECPVWNLPSSETHVPVVRSRVSMSDFEYYTGCITRLLPLPNLPYLQRANCRYAAFRKLSMLKLNSPAWISLRALIHTSSMSLSRHMFENTLYDVKQVTLLQHKFSCSSGIGLQTPHLHHWGELSGRAGSSGSLAVRCLAKSRLPLPMPSKVINNWSFFSTLRLDT